MPEIIQLSQDIGWQVIETVFYMYRTYAYGLHRKKLIVVGKWPYSTRNENCIIQNNLPSVSGAATVTKRTDCPLTCCTVSQWPVQTDMLVSSVPPSPPSHLPFPSPLIPHQATGLDDDPEDWCGDRACDGDRRDYVDSLVSVPSVQQSCYPTIPDTGLADHVSTGGKLGTEQIFNNKTNYLDTIGPSAISENELTLLNPGRGDHGVLPLDQRLSDQHCDAGLHACSGECAGSTCGCSCGGGGGENNDIIYF